MSIGINFKIVGDTAVINYEGHTIHLNPNGKHEPSSLIVFKISPLGTLEGPAVFGPVSVTLENIITAKDFIDAVNNPDSDPMLPAFLTRQAE